jgi:hypothetical protein
MAIPFYEAVLKQRLPIENTIELKTLDPTQLWLGDTLTHEVFKGSTYTGNIESFCLLPDSIAAAKWKEYVITGNVADQTPPPSPYDLQIKWEKDSVRITWKADADVESGIKYFNFYKNGKLIGRFPNSGTYQTFDTNGDNSIPKIPAPMKFMIASQNLKETIISIRTVNNFDLESEETKISCCP